MSRVFFILRCVAAALGLLARPISAETESGSLYSPIGKRDPFKPPESSGPDRTPSAIESVERYSIDQLRLRAILRGSSGPRAMFEDPQGKTFILKQGDVIGRERGSVSRILNTDVIVTERTFNYLGTESLYERVISLPQD